MKKHPLVSILIFVCLLLPNTTNAQFASESEYRAYLFAVIELLQQQIVLLQAEHNQEGVERSLVVSTKPTDTADFNSFLIEDTDEIVAWYQLSQPGSAIDVEDKEHRRHFSRFFDLVPNQYDSYFLELLVFRESGQDFDGFVETVPPYREDTWRLGVNESIFELTPTSALVEELFIHEFAHIISYESIIGRVEPQNTTCHEYFSALGCPPANSYLTDFVEEFWNDEDLDALGAYTNIDDVWTKRELREDFVSDYAATSPAEDFAESFTAFVLDGRSSGNELVDEKINYFYQYENFLDLRTQILAAL
jgi:hypothetical protein